MQSLEERIITSISKRGRGTIVSPLDYAGYGDSKAVQKAFERLTVSKKLIRVARGIYCYPKIDKVWGLGVLYPTFEKIAAAIARRDKAKIVPTGVYALNKLGLSTQLPMNVDKFLSLTEAQHRTVFEQTAIRVKLPVASIEKDFWVTEILNILFSLPYADRMVFKGGTSLSKVWGVIRRFSEDIDIAIDRSMFGIEGDVTKKHLKKLRKSSVFV